MGPLRIRMVVGLVLGLAMLCAAAPAIAGQAFVNRHPVYAGADAYFGDCPAEPGPAGSTCTDTYLIVWRGYSVTGGGSVAASKAPWVAAAETVRVDFDGTDDPPVTTLRIGGGLIGNGSVTADPVHLTSLSASFTIPMNDGSTFAFTGSWTASSPRQHYGNDGPAGQFPTHSGDRCFTLNDHAHQKFRFARMTGTLDGQPVQSYEDFAFAATIFNNSFQFIAVPHGGCS